MIIPVWQDGKSWRNVEQTLSTISLSYGVSIESDIQHTFLEMKDPTSWLYVSFLKRQNFQILMPSDNQRVYCNVERGNLGKLVFVDILYVFKSGNFNEFVENDKKDPWSD